MDECWLGVTGSQDLFGNGVAIAEKIRQTVKKELGITVSIGVSFNKVFAKLGSDMKKPDAITVLDKSCWKDKIWPFPVSELLFVGYSTTRKLLDRGVYTIGDLAKVEPRLLKSWFGVNGIMLWRFANGQDTSRVMLKDFVEPIASVGHGITCSCDLHHEEPVWKVILSLSQDIGHRLRIYDLAAKGVRLSIRSNDLSGRQFQMQLPYPSQSPYEIAQAARTLFARRYSWFAPVRAVCVTAINLIPSNQPMQTDMFGDEVRRMRRKKLEDCIDEIRGRFGNNSMHKNLNIIRIGRFFQTGSIPMNSEKLWAI